MDQDGSLLSAVSLSCSGEFLSPGDVIRPFISLNEFCIGKLIGDREKF